MELKLKFICLKFKFQSQKFLYETYQRYYITCNSSTDLCAACLINNSFGCFSLCISINTIRNRHYYSINISIDIQLTLNFRIIYILFNNEVRQAAHFVLCKAYGKSVTCTYDIPGRLHYERYQLLFILENYSQK